MFLDAIGVPSDSVRRNTLRGIYDRVTLNAGQHGSEVAVLLLDERYDRTPLPCHTRRRYCQPDTHKSKWHRVCFPDWLRKWAAGVESIDCMC